VSRLSDLAADPAATIVTAELPIVDGGDLDTVRAYLEPMARFVDAVNATDNTAGHAHASNVATAIAIAHCGVEPIMQVVCRDKNRLALQSDIVGAALFGVRNISCLTGDDVTAGDEPEARRVFDLDGPQLIRVATALKHGTYLSGRRLDPPPDLFIGAVENPSAPPIPYRTARTVKKIQAGARFFQLQICYHADRLESYLATLHRIGATTQAAFLPTICLIRGARALRFMHDHVPGIDVPATTLARIEATSDQREAAYQLALEQARHALAQPGVRGIHITDFRHDGSVGRLVTDLGLADRAGTAHEEPHAHDTAVAL
jgi:methylenetetrahydrofolate reductase (NADPH)